MALHTAAMGVLLQVVKQQSSSRRMRWLPGHLQHCLQHCGPSPAAAAMLQQLQGGLRARWNLPCCSAHRDCNKVHSQATPRAFHAQQI